MGTDPSDLEALRRQLADLQAKLSAAEQSAVAGADTGVVTHGGASVQGSVNAGGHFIGRDFIQILGHVFQGVDPDEAGSVIAHYLEALVADLAGLKLGEIDVGAQEARREPLRLADVYVPLDTHLRIPADSSLKAALARGPSREGREMDPQRETRPVPVLEALAEHRELTLIGKPGSGKSTFGASVLLTLAQVWQGHRDQLAELGETWTYDALLPVRVVLRRFAERIPGDDRPVRAGDLWRFIADDLEAAGYGLSDKTPTFVQRIARTHGALILLDGLDECGGSVTRERVLAAVSELMRTAGDKCRFLLTARPYAWRGGPDPGQGVYALADLSDERVEQFIQGWYSALATRGWLGPGDAERRRNDLLGAWRRPDLRHLAANPLLLTLMATLHANRGTLPDDRADLYDESVSLLMLRWNRSVGADKALLDALDIPGLKLSDLRGVLEELAFRVHEDSATGSAGLGWAVGEGDEPAAGGAADIGEDRLVRAFRPLLDGSRDKAAIVVRYIEERAGLLIAQGERGGERQFAFPHRTFQEFLAACHLAAQDDFPVACARLGRAAPGHWQLVLALAARLAKPERGASAADELIGGISIGEFRSRREPASADWACALLAGTQLQEIGLGAVRQRVRTRAIAARVADWIAAALPLHPDQGGLPARERAYAGDVLAGLGDPRFDPARLHLPVDDMLGFVHVPADPDFRIGTRASDAKRLAEVMGREVPDDEINDAPSPSPSPGFYIARYPVTVAQLRAFVQATSFGLWVDLSLRDPDSRPARWVSWHEALA